MPVEYLNGGIFACELLRHPYDKNPIIIWDAVADLGEQTLTLLAEDKDTYIRLREADENFFDITLSDRRRRQRKAEKELFHAISVFNQFSEAFHSGYQVEQGSTKIENGQDKPVSTFEHDRLNRLPRYDAWKPQRFCVHDHLMGVMGNRFNRATGCLEVTGYATKDHTNYARASATRSLLLCFLCEWAKQSATKGIIFLDNWDDPIQEPRRVPHEIRVYAHILGIKMQPNATQIDHATCRALFLELTDFSQPTRKILSKSDLSIKACLMVHKGIWTVHQLEDLIRYCPMISTLFEDNLQSANQVHMGMLMEHARLTVMSGLAQQMVQVQAEEKNASIIVLDTDEESKKMPYSRLISCECDIELCCFEDGRRIKKTLSSGIDFALWAWPATPHQFKQKLGSILKFIENFVSSFSQNRSDDNRPKTICLVVPTQATINQSVDVVPSSGIHLVLMDETLDMIDQAAWRNLQQSQRIRK